MSAAEEIGARLRELRSVTGDSQRSFAEKVGAAQRSWADYETGRSIPGGLVLAGIAHLGFNTNWVLTGEGELRLGAVEMRSDSSPLNEGLLEACISGVEKHLADRRQTLPPAKKATLISLLYMEVLEREGESPHTDKPGGEALGDLIGRFVRLAS